LYTFSTCPLHVPTSYNSNWILGLYLEALVLLIHHSCMLSCPHHNKIPSLLLPYPITVYLNYQRLMPIHNLHLDLLDFHILNLFISFLYLLKLMEFLNLFPHIFLLIQIFLQNYSFQILLILLLLPHHNILLHHLQFHLRFEYFLSNTK
jgi:hypothetical protein